MSKRELDIAALTPGIAPGPAGSDVLLESEDAVGTITIDRPADQNRLTHDVLLGLQAVIDRLGADQRVQAVVIAGSGSQFFSMASSTPRSGRATARSRPRTSRGPRRSPGFSRPHSDIIMARRLARARGGGRIDLA
jgi:Enoyl-CoA hydratase/isomerase